MSDENGAVKVRKRVPMDAIPTITEFAEHREYLGLEYSPAQRACLKCIYGLPLTDEELALYRECTGRDVYTPPVGGYRDVTIIAGRRSGKDSRLACVMAVYEAIYGAWAKYHSLGERIVIPLVAQNLDGTRNAYKYIKDYIEASNRIGGRCFAETQSFGVAFDRGAHFIHNPDSNPLTRLAARTGLEI
jgi:hypothetical protein